MESAELIREGSLLEEEREREEERRDGIDKLFTCEKGYGPLLLFGASLMDCCCCCAGSCVTTIFGAR